MGPNALKVISAKIPGKASYADLKTGNALARKRQRKPVFPQHASAKIQTANVKGSVSAPGKV
jgi:hypothetical protein